MARTLTITRTRNFQGAACKWDVELDGYVIGDIRNGETRTFSIDERAHNLRIVALNAWGGNGGIDPGSAWIMEGNANYNVTLAVGMGLLKSHVEVTCSCDSPSPEVSFKKEKTTTGLFDAIKNTYQDKKAANQAERDFVCNNKGTMAICAYMKMVFDKGNPGYKWLKENSHWALYTKVEGNQVLLCYQYTEQNPQSFREAKPQDVEVGRYSFQEMYQWFGLQDGEGYSWLDTKLKCRTLDDRISSAVQELPHIKYNGGFRVKMFQ